MGQIVPQQGATFRMNAGAAAPGQTLKKFNGNQVLSGVATTTTGLYTVTPGMTFYLTDCLFTTASTTPIEIQIQAGGISIFRGFVSNVANLSFPGIETQPTAAGNQAVAIFFPLMSGPPNVSFFVSGFEQQ